MLKRITRFIAIFLGLFIVVSAIIATNSYLGTNKLLFYGTGTNHKAFLHATWEMSQKEIERANKTVLSLPEIEFFDFPDTHYPKVLNMARYKSRIQNGITIWGHDSKVQYSFFDDKLFEYTVFIKGYDSGQLHEEISNNLNLKYGEGVNESKNDKYLHKMSWNTDLITVDYWLVQENSTNPFLSVTYLAGIRFGYKPMFKQIQDITSKEHKELF